MVKVRNRTSVGPRYRGKFTNLYGTVTEYESAPTSEVFTQDFVQTGYPIIKGNNLFDSTSRGISYAPINGVQHITSYYRQTWENVPPLWARNPPYSHLPNLSGTFLDPAGLIAGTNPSRPSVDIPVMLYELKDVPFMVRQLYDHLVRSAQILGADNMPALLELSRDKNGRLPELIPVGVDQKGRRILRFPNVPMSQKAGEAWLNYNFGWRPLVSDLMTLSGLQAAVSKRALEMAKHIQPDMGLRYKKEVGTKEGTQSGSSSSMTSIDMDFQTLTRQHKWLTCRWSYMDNLPLHSLFGDKSGRLAAAVAGLDISFSTAWEAMPWSWLIDWFSSMGAILTIHRNLAGYRLSRASMMTHTETRTNYVYKRGGPAVYHGGEGHWTYETKNRAPMDSLSLFTASLPFLGAGQVATLASLAHMGVDNRVARR